MDMKIFNEKLKLINEDYPLTLPPWLILSGQVISSAFILTKITHGLVLFETQKKYDHIVKNCPFIGKNNTE